VQVERAVRTEDVAAVPALVPVERAAPLLRIADLSKRFEHRDGRKLLQTAALEGFSLDVQRGQFVAIIGPSGCGKSTVLRIIDGLLKPTSGTVTLNGKPIDGPGPDRAVVFQHANLLPWRTVEDNIRFGMECLGVKGAERRRRTAHYLGLVGLEGFERYYPSQLSGGMQQRVGLARAFAAEPEILLLDEPFGALDAQTRLVLQDELARLLAGDERTAVLVTHDMEEAVFLADVVVVMSSRPGRIVEVVNVDLPRPRDSDVRSTERFAQLKGHLWETLRERRTEADEVEP
jgi:ABC-type nitrate/sulfonate/bicarbonate transport system ATPase subunit